MLTSGTALVRIERLGVRQRETALLDDIDFTILDGERLLLLGVSGAGKSLLIDAIADNIPHSGSVHFAHGLGKAQRSFSYDMFATLSLLKGREVLHLLERINRAPRHDAMMKRLRVHELLEKPVRVLSKGERKRLGVYLALFAEPMLAILDEPTDGMDPLLRDAFWEIVAERRGATLLTTHLWDEAQAHHDRIALLAAGRLLAPPASGAELIAGVGLTGKIVVDAGFPVDPGERSFVHEKRRSVFFTGADEKTALIARATQADRGGGYSVLPVDLRDVYVLLGGALEAEAEA